LWEKGHKEFIFSFLDLNPVTWSMGLPGNLEVALGKRWGVGGPAVPPGQPGQDSLLSCQMGVPQRNLNLP
jgi:hypothetical protein